MTITKTGKDLLNKNKEESQSHTDKLKTLSDDAVRLAGRLRKDKLLGLAREQLGTLNFKRK